MKIINKTIKNILDELAAESSINEKINILKKNDSNLLRKVLKAAYDNKYVYGIKKILEFKPIEKESILEEAIDHLIKYFHEEKNRGNKAIEKFKTILESLNKDDAEVLIRIIERDLKCGINKKLIQKVFPDLIEEIGYMGAVKYDPKKIKKIIKENEIILSQEKMDGEYSNMIFDKKIEFYSRKNKIQKLPKKWINEIESVLYKPRRKIFNGELIIEGYDRYTSNGLLSRIFKYEEYLENNENKKAEKALKIIEEIAGCSYDDLIQKIRYYIWDYQDFNEKYLERFHKVIGFIENSQEHFPYFKLVPTRYLIKENYKEKNKLIEHCEVYSFMNIDYKVGDDERLYEEVHNHFTEMISEGKEGTIIKATNQVWKDGKPTFQVKMKFEKEVTLKIVGFEPGTPGSKYENTLGVFLCESEDGKVKARVGGIDEETRDEIWKNKDKYLNKLIDVKGNALSKAKDRDEYAILHPRFTKFREDKEKADTFKEIEEIFKN